MPTARQIAAQRKQLRQQLERDRRTKDRKRLLELRAHLKSAKRLKGQRMREVVIACRHARARLKAARRALRARYEHDLALAREQARLASRKNCDAKKDRARSKGQDRLQRAAAAIAAERAHQDQLRNWARRTPFQRAPARRADAISESNSEVAHNLPHDLLPVWRAVQGRIRSTPRRSRTETFLEWVEEHRGEVRRIIDREIDRDVAELARNEAELRRQAGSARHYRRLTDRQLSDVPF